MIDCDIDHENDPRCGDGERFFVSTEGWIENNISRKLEDVGRRRWFLCEFQHNGQQYAIINKRCFNWNGNSSR